MPLKRTASKLLAETYAALCAAPCASSRSTSEEPLYIQPTLLSLWQASGSGEAVAAESFVALELAARAVMNTRRTCFAHLEQDAPDLIKPLFERAITLTENKCAQTGGDNA